MYEPRWVTLLLRKREIDPEKGCWLYTGALIAGYGVYCREYVHRLAVMNWGDYFGRDVEDGEHVHHRCSVPKCFNPEHLIALSPEDHSRVHSHSRTQNPEFWL